MTDTRLERLQKAIDLAGGMYSIPSILRDVQAGRMQVWTNQDAVVVTQIGVYPECKVLWVLLAGGSLEGVLALQERGAAWAKAQGCKRMVMDGRSGWEKPLTAKGWRKHCVRYAFDL